MTFALILVILTLLSGFVVLLNKLWFRHQNINSKIIRKIIEHASSFFPIFLTVLLLRSFIIEPFRIPSGSLEPTLKVGDFVAVNKFAYGLRLPVSETKIIAIQQPKHGDIAVFRWPPAPHYDYIKRVIGVPGDLIQYNNKLLTINGKPMEQKFIKYMVDENSGKSVAKYRENLDGIEHDIYIRPAVKASNFKIQVPEGQYFMMGDNRDDSADSRFWGFVSDKYLRGKAFFVWMSWDSKISAPRWSSIGHMIY
ncbi:MAG: signal peptidase I [Legionellales bacterium RIFCSPHIGHO2_12_FULL_42_9]|nr:MAG: signal peptidase I [Legionellales bacterium RIFCSPHIGHO2_12_FULL_42_9]